MHKLKDTTPFGNATVAVEHLNSEIFMTASSMGGSGEPFFKVKWLFLSACLYVIIFLDSLCQNSGKF